MNKLLCALYFKEHNLCDIYLFSIMCEEDLGHV